MDPNLDAIVKEVLHRLGQLPKSYLVGDLDYPACDSKHFGLTQCLTKKDDLTPDMTLWIPEMSRAQMMSVASGVPTDLVSEWTIEALLLGVKVQVLEQRFEFNSEACAVSPLWKKHVEAYDLLLQSGLTLIGSNKTSSKVKYFNGRVLCEKTVLGWTRETVEKVMVGRDTLITPAAMDVLKSERIQWSKE